ncbi:unnamed protein product [Amoebophrya sp. A120]|nr:unnamed protein product [Amoebophrya sp. A120]|eukprot:GSA120T00002411001.1
MNSGADQCSSGGSSPASNPRARTLSAHVRGYEPRPPRRSSSPPSRRHTVAYYGMNPADAIEGPANLQFRNAAGIPSSSENPLNEPAPVQDARQSQKRGKPALELRRCSPAQLASTRTPLAMRTIVAGRKNTTSGGRASFPAATGGASSKESASSSASGVGVVDRQTGCNVLPFADVSRVKRNPHRKGLGSPVERNPFDSENMIKAAASKRESIQSGLFEIARDGERQLEVGVDAHPTAADAETAEVTHAGDTFESEAAAENGTAGEQDEFVKNATKNPCSITKSSAFQQPNTFSTCRKPSARRTSSVSFDLNAARAEHDGGDSDGDSAASSVDYLMGKLEKTLAHDVKLSEKPGAVRNQIWLSKLPLKTQDTIVNFFSKLEDYKLQDSFEEEFSELSGAEVKRRLDFFGKLKEVAIDEDIFLEEVGKSNGAQITSALEFLQVLNMMAEVGVWDDEKENFTQDTRQSVVSPERPSLVPIAEVDRVNDDLAQRRSDQRSLDRERAMHQITEIDPRVAAIFQNKPTSSGSSSSSSSSAASAVGAANTSAVHLCFPKIRSNHTLGAPSPTLPVGVFVSDTVDQVKDLLRRVILTEELADTIREHTRGEFKEIFRLLQRNTIKVGIMLDRFVQRRSEELGIPVRKYRGWTPQVAVDTKNGGIVMPGAAQAHDKSRSEQPAAVDEQAAPVSQLEGGAEGERVEVQRPSEERPRAAKTSLPDPGNRSSSDRSLGQAIASKSASEGGPPERKYRSASELDNVKNASGENRSVKQEAGCGREDLALLLEYEITTTHVVAVQPQLPSSASHETGLVVSAPGLADARSGGKEKSDDLSVRESVQEKKAKEVVKENENKQRQDKLGAQSDQKRQGGHFQQERVNQRDQRAPKESAAQDEDVEMSDVSADVGNDVAMGCANQEFEPGEESNKEGATDRAGAESDKEEAKQCQHSATAAVSDGSAKNAEELAQQDSAAAGAPRGAAISDFEAVSAGEEQRDSERHGRRQSESQKRVECSNAAARGIEMPASVVTSAAPQSRAAAPTGPRTAIHDDSKGESSSEKKMPTGLSEKAGGSTTEHKLSSSIPTSGRGSDAVVQEQNAVTRASVSNAEQEVNIPKRCDPNLLKSNEPGTSSSSSGKEVHTTGRADPKPVGHRVQKEGLEQATATGSHPRGVPDVTGSLDDIKEAGQEKVAAGADDRRGILQPGVPHMQSQRAKRVAEDRALSGVGATDQVPVEAFSSFTPGTARVEKEQTLQAVKGPRARPPMLQNSEKKGEKQEHDHGRSDPKSTAAILHQPTRGAEAGSQEVAEYNKKLDDCDLVMTVIAMRIGKHLGLGDAISKAPDFAELQAFASTCRIAFRSWKANDLAPSRLELRFMAGPFLFVLTKIQRQTLFDLLLLSRSVTAGKSDLKDDDASLVGPLLGARSKTEKKLVGECPGGVERFDFALHDAAMSTGDKKTSQKAGSSLNRFRVFHVILAIAHVVRIQASKGGNTVPGASLLDRSNLRDPVRKFVNLKLAEKIANNLFPHLAGTVCDCGRDDPVFKEKMNKVQAGLQGMIQRKHVERVEVTELEKVCCHEGEECDASGYAFEFVSVLYEREEDPPRHYWTCFAPPRFTGATSTATSSSVPPAKVSAKTQSVGFAPGKETARGEPLVAGEEKKFAKMKVANKSNASKSTIQGGATRGDGKSIAKTAGLVNGPTFSKSTSDAGPGSNKHGIAAAPSSSSSDLLGNSNPFAIHQRSGGKSVQKFFDLYKDTSWSTAGDGVKEGYSINVYEKSINLYDHSLVYAGGAEKGRIQVKKEAFSDGKNPDLLIVKSEENPVKSSTVPCGLRFGSAPNCSGVQKELLRSPEIHVRTQPGANPETFLLSKKLTKRYYVKPTSAAPSQSEKGKAVKSTGSALAGSGTKQPFQEDEVVDKFFREWAGTQWISKASKAEKLATGQYSVRVMAGTVELCYENKVVEVVGKAEFSAVEAGLIELSKDTCRIRSITYAKEDALDRESWEFLATITVPPTAASAPSTGSSKKNSDCFYVEFSYARPAKISRK